MLNAVKHLAESLAKSLREILPTQRSVRMTSSQIIGQLLYYCLSSAEPKTGLEPVTYALRMRCSTN